MVRVTQLRGPRDPLMAAMWVAVSAICVYVVVRASMVGLTHDESLSYGFVWGDSGFIDLSNNHWLNSWLMQVSGSLFGHSELALRLPNIAAYVLYGVCCGLLLVEARHAAARIAGFTVLFLNPFLLEFFSLARGYGLSLGFAAAALAALLVARERQASAWEDVARLALIAVAGGLAVYANPTALNLVLALLGVQLGETVVRAAARRPRQLGPLMASAALAVAAYGGLLPVVRHAFDLEKRGELYFGGEDGFVTDTLGSLLTTAAYLPANAPPPRWLSAAQLIVVSVVAAAGLWAVFRFVSGRCCAWGNLQRAAVVVVAVVAAPVLLSGWRGTLYPIERTALVYVLTFGVLVAFAIDDVLRVSAARPTQVPLAFLAGAICVLAAVNLVGNANAHQTLTWDYDASTRRAVEELRAIERRQGPPPQPWKLIAGFPRHEVFSYYRARFKLQWLQPVTREPTTTEGADFYYVGKEDIATLPGGTTLIRTFPEAGTQLRA
ncbi:MAG: hypothetical protein LC799_05410, partial [Actinobacteria bacterium]|nr:hypothetical protein [Actinomycetota bacterium]